MKRHISEADHQKLTTEIGSFAILGNNELKARWKAVYGTAAPARMKRDLLRYAVAYRMQECALSGLKPSTRRLLERVADDAGARRPVKVTPACKAQAGAVLLLKWAASTTRLRCWRTECCFAESGIARSPQLRV
jgi:hypothetical protein